MVELVVMKYNLDSFFPTHPCRERVPDVPIEVMYPKEADLGLWGGEGIVKGYVKPRKYFQAGWP